MESIGGDPKRRSSAPKGRQPDRWGVRAGGRLFVTSLALLTLEVYYSYPLFYQPNDSDPVADPKPADERTVSRPIPAPQHSGTSRPRSQARTA